MAKGISSVALVEALARAGMLGFFGAAGLLVEEGKIAPVIDRVSPLDDGPAAVAHVVSGHTQGKTIITMGQAAD